MSENTLQALKYIIRHIYKTSIDGHLQNIFIIFFIFAMVVHKMYIEFELCLKTIHV